jgi:sugar/nucleoside kinase (ribokinase family)
VGSRYGREIGALDRHTRDLLVEVTLGQAERAFRELGLPAHGVAYLPPDQREEITRQLSDGYPQPLVSPGGNSSNTLYNIGLIQGGRAEPFSLHWFGSMKGRDPREILEPADSLRRVGVMPHCSEHSRAEAVALCVVEQDTRETLSIVVSRGSPPRVDPGWPTTDVLIVGLDVFLRTDGPTREWVGTCREIALIIDTTSSRAELAAITSSSVSEKIRWVFGRASELQSLGLLSESPHPALQAAEFVATGGSEPVAVWDPSRTSMLSLPVEPIDRPTGDDIGAGDAYAGAYLYGRISGAPIEDAHRFAAAWAKEVLLARGARLPPPTNLDTLFGERIDRHSSDTAEGRLFERIRQTHGLTLISGGQTGVDQFALASATALGLATFAILPLGGRTEIRDRTPLDDESFGGAYAIELGSSSFRYRTWANAYLADGTLVWDLHEGEGSKATRDACTSLGRPCLDLAGMTPSEAAHSVRRWMTRHRIRILNGAGNRSSLLSAEEKRHLKHAIDMVLRSAAGAVAGRFEDPVRIRSSIPTAQGHRGAAHPPRRLLTVGASNARSYRAFVERWLHERLGMQPGEPKRFVVEGERVRVAYLRPRDLPDLLGDPRVDAIMCGCDVLEDRGVEFTILVDTGLFNQLIALVGNETVATSEAWAQTNIVSQYPTLATKLLGEAGIARSVQSIDGSAEAWLLLRLGEVTAAVDTWRTGRTAEANNLKMLRALGSTSLVLATSPQRLRHRAAELEELADDLVSWLQAKPATPPAPNGRARLQGGIRNRSK